MRLYLVAGFSFLAGMCGYIMVRFWILPIGRYRRAKGQLLQRLNDYRKLLPEDDGTPLKRDQGRKILREIRRQGVALVDLHDQELPYWYRLALLSRKESPEAATDPILRLENMPNGGQARKCLREIGGHLGFRELQAP